MHEFGTAAGVRAGGKNKRGRGRRWGRGELHETARIRDAIHERSRGCIKEVIDGLTVAAHVLY
jgi:hypothetical protein